MVSRRQAKLRASIAFKALKQYATSQLCNNNGKFNFTPVAFNPSALPPSNNDLNTVAGLVDDHSFTFDDKLVKTLSLSKTFRLFDGIAMWPGSYKGSIVALV